MRFKPQAVKQLDEDTEEVLNIYPSLCEAERETGVPKGRSAM